jgi:hypothetical protein
MKPIPFGFIAARSAADALEAAAHHRDEAEVLAGGQSPVAMLSMRRAV